MITMIYYKNRELDYFWFNNEEQMKEWIKGEEEEYKKVLLLKRNKYGMEEILFRGNMKNFK